MFSSRNIHFAILGLILGASAGYVYAFVRATPVAPAPVAAVNGGGGVPAGHPDVSQDQMLEAMRQAVEADPTQPELVIRYAVALYESGRMNESEQWFARAAANDPKDLYARSMHGAVLWQLDRKEEAQTELEAVLRIDPEHIPSLHGLMLLAVEKKDRARSAELLGKIEKFDPAYEALPSLQNRFREAFGTGK